MSVLTNFIAGIERGKARRNALADLMRRDEPGSVSAVPAPRPVPYAPGDERDVAIRTMLGEAAGEGDSGMAAVAHVLKNRAADPRWAGNVRDVALDPYQFSAWNSGEGGNDLVTRYGPGSPEYERAGAIYDAVMAGMPDPTRGATHYYAFNTINEPGWFGALTPTATIGGHRFAK